MGELTQNCKEIATRWLLGRGMPISERLTITDWVLAFARMYREDTKLLPQTDTTTFIPLTHGTNIKQLPKISRIISVGTQLGRYVKALAVNSHLATNTKVTDSMGLVAPDRNNNIWYYGGLFGYGWGYGGTGQQGTTAYGNGMDYGDYDIKDGVLYTSPTFAFNNVAVRGFTDCIADSEDTCIEWDFITSADFYLDWRFDKMRGNATVGYSWQTFEDNYMYQLRQRNRPSRGTLIKTIERSRGRG